MDIFFAILVGVVLGALFSLFLRRRAGFVRVFRSLKGRRAQWINTFFAAEKYMKHLIYGGVSKCLV